MNLIPPPKFFISPLWNLSGSAPAIRQIDKTKPLLSQKSKMGMNYLEKCHHQLASKSNIQEVWVGHLKTWSHNRTHSLQIYFTIFTVSRTRERQTSTVFPLFASVQAGTITGLVCLLSTIYRWLHSSKIS